MSEDSHSKEAVYSNTNGFPFSNGKNLHMDIGHGELANRILTVGSVTRLELIAKYLDLNSITLNHTSSRGFTCVTGTYNGIKVSIVSIGMGISMMDFFVRESRAVTDGPMVIVRFGTCGGLTKCAPSGTIVVASKGSAYVHRNVDAFSYNYCNNSQREILNLEEAYVLSKIAPSCPNFSAVVSHQLRESLGTEHVVEGINISADSFYSSQGRIDDNFDDCNQHLINDYILKTYPDACSMEMETFALLHLAKCCKKTIYATAAAIVVANRLSAEVIPGDLLNHMEDKGGEAMLKALTSFQL